MLVEQDFLDNVMSSVGEPIQFSAISPTSFSSSPNVAREFIDTGDPGIKMLFVMENERGSSITHNSLVPEQAEVLHRSGEKYTISSVILDGDTYIVELEDGE